MDFAGSEQSPEVEKIDLGNVFTAVKVRLKETRVPLYPVSHGSPIRDRWINK